MLPSSLSLFQRSLLVGVALLLLAPQVWAEAPLNLGDNDVFTQIDAYVMGQPSPVTAYDIANQFAFVADDPVYGTAAQFVASPTNIAVAALSSTHFVVAYQRSFQGRAIVGSVSGTTITYGSENTFNAASTSNISVAALSSTHFVVGYRDQGNSFHGTAIVGEVSGTTISSYGSENVFNAASTERISIAALSSTHFVVGYRDFGNSNQGTAIVGEVSGTTISSYGSENVFNAASTSPSSIAALSSTHFVVGYGDGGNSSHGTAIVGTVSGTTITYGSENVFNAASTSAISVAALSSTHFVVGYSDSGNSDHGTAIVGTVSGTTISSYGSENVFNAARTDPISVEALDAATFVVAYYDGNFDDIVNAEKTGSVSCVEGTCTYNSIVGDVSGTAISAYSNEVAIDASSGNTTGTPAVANLGSFVVAYLDIEDSNGKAVVSSSGGSLPVELTHFSARLDHNDILLRWNTASETNNAGFDIQYQPLGPDDEAPAAKLGNWHSATFITGYGTTTEAQTYTHRLDGFAPGTYRFRLKQIDFDGTFAYSPVTEVTITLPEQYALSAAYPNPFNPETQFTLSVQQRQAVTVRVYDVLGRAVATLHEGVLGANQEHRFRFDATGQSSGWYQIEVTGETFQASERVLLMK